MKGNDVRSILAACDFSSDANYAARRAAHLACEHGAQLKLTLERVPAALRLLVMHAGGDHLRPVLGAETPASVPPASSEATPGDVPAPVAATG